MADATVLIVSNDKHFSAVVAEQVKRELSLACQSVVGGEEAKGLMASVALVIASEPLQKEPSCPVVIPKTKPFRLHELLTEVDAALQKISTGEQLELGRGFGLQVKQKQLTHSGRIADLTDKEVQLLQCLTEAKGESVTKEQLLKQVWGFESALDTHTLETHIYRLRGKFRELADGEDMIAAIEGGYGLLRV